jgi:restriction system protein
MKMTFLDAAYEVLKGSPQPLHYTEIASRAKAADLLDSKGHTPEATMGSRLYVDTQQAGTRFRRVGRGVFGLKESPTGDIAHRIRALNQSTRVDLRRRLLQMPWDRFEGLIGELLIAIGFDEQTVVVTRHSGDGGIDVRGVLSAGGITAISAAVQVKRWKHNVQAPTVRELRGSLNVHEHGILITTSDYSSGARQEAEEIGRTRISLVNGEQLLDLLIARNIGVVEEQHTLISLDEEWWGELSGEPVGVEVGEEQSDSDIPAVEYPLRIQAHIHGQTYQAELLDADGRVQFQGHDYSSPSAAGQIATGWKTCNGWALWRYHDAATGEWHSIDELRG